MAVVGGGIVGLATAYQLLRQRPASKVLLLEKEAEFAAHQTGHNSGVIHSGIYYRPGSKKATNCRAGKQALEQFCREEEIPFETCGKVIVATSDAELPALEKIAERGIANEVECRRIGTAELAELEPHATGTAALHVPETGIVDYKQVSKKLADKISQADGILLRSTEVLATKRTGGKYVLETTQGDFRAKLVVTCAGLHADRVARQCQFAPEAKIIPFRGEYFELRPKSSHLCRNLIYPVPDPRFPFLGVHFTRMIHGGVECGPNAVLAFSREGYRKTDFNSRDFLESLGYAGFRKLGRKYWSMGMAEMWRSMSKRAFVRSLQKLIPEIQATDLVAAPAGVRAQAVTPHGELVDDFLIQTDQRMIHVLNAPSPAATASLNIGLKISEIAILRLE